MKNLFTFLIINIFVFTINIPIELRGIVEGFYGTPWTFEDRADLIKFSNEVNFNAYIYAPKDDPYHRDQWRVPYPEEKIIELKNLISLSIQNKVRFIFAVSPGIDLNFYGDEGEEDFNNLMIKLDSLYKIGCRDFAIFFDDISLKSDSGINQAYFLNKLQDSLDSKYSDINPVITVPTEYWRTSMVDSQGNLKQYTGDFVNNLSKKILVLYTGEEVVGDGLSNENYKKATDIYQRELGIWWNYPVNDYLSAKRALGPIEKLPSTKVQSIFYNPMEQVQLSKISLATGADYALSPDTYDADKSWNKAIEKQFGDLASYMKVFAKHSRYMDNYSWAKVGPPDGPEFYEESHNAIESFKEKKEFDFTKLFELIDEMENSAIILLGNLSDIILAECKPQLEQFLRIANADRVAAKSLQNAKLDSQLTNLRNDIKIFSDEALISEESGVKFIDEVIELFNSY